MQSSSSLHCLPTQHSGNHMQARPVCAIALSVAYACETGCAPMVCWVAMDMRYAMAKPCMLVIQSGAFLRMHRPWLSRRLLYPDVSLAPKATPLHNSHWYALQHKLDTLDCVLTNRAGSRRSFPNTSVERGRNTEAHRLQTPAEQTSNGT